MSGAATYSYWRCSLLILLSKPETGTLIFSISVGSSSPLLTSFSSSITLGGNYSRLLDPIVFMWWFDSERRFKLDWSWALPLGSWRPGVATEDGLPARRGDSFESVPGVPICSVPKFGVSDRSGRERNKPASVSFWALRSGFWGFGLRSYLLGAGETRICSFS